MEIVSDIQKIREIIFKTKQQKRSIGFVPTMGALHQGHLKLVNASTKENDLTICSIFVNPTQFNNAIDLKNYPRETDTDIAKLQEANCDVVFTPSVKTIYEDESVLNISFGYLEDIMEGKFRPGHFKGVGLVVAKLFNITTPDKAYFGTKDLQQLTIIKKLVKELLFDIKIVPIETVREIDGLAMSSRNKLLSQTERAQAIDLFNALTTAKQKLIDGESVIAVTNYVEEFFRLKSMIQLEYFEIVNSDDLKVPSEIRAGDQVSLCIAGNLGNVRLIDNISLN